MPAFMDNKSKKAKGTSERKSFTRQREQFNTDTIWTDEFRAAIEIALQEGGAIRLGLTRDGGALAVGIYGLGGDPTTEYLRPSDDPTEFWNALYHAFKGDGE